MTIIAPSLLAADWTDIRKDLDSATVGGAEWMHFDVMDGIFVPAKTYTPEQLKEVSDACGLIMDVHVMVADPIKYAREYIPMGADYFTFHIESTDKPQDVIDEIKRLNCKVGITLKPGTPVSEIEPYLNQVDLVLVMSVEPGKGGQSFMECQLEKVKYLASKQAEHGYLIQIDGGINDKTSKLAVEAGADVLVSGSYIFKSEDRKAAIASLKHEK